MGVLHKDLLALRFVDLLLVFVGEGGFSHVERVSDVDLVLQNVGYGFSGPSVGSGGIQIGAGSSGSLVVLVGRIQHLLSGQNSGDLVWTFPCSAQVKDPTHDGGGLFIRDDLFGVLILLFVAVGRFAAQPLSALRLHLLDGAHLLAGVLGVELVGPVPDRIEVVAALHQGIHTVVDRNEADALFRKVDLRVLSHLEVFSSQAAEILDDESRHLAALNHLYDLLPRGAVEAGTGISVVGQEQGILKAVVSRILFEEEFLRRDLSRLFSPAEYKCPTLL